MEIKPKTADDYRQERNALFHDLEVATAKICAANKKIANLELAMRMECWNVKVLQENRGNINAILLPMIPEEVIQGVQKYERPRLNEQEGHNAK